MFKAQNTPICKNHLGRLCNNANFWFLAFFVLAVFCGIAFFYGFSSYPILDMNEGLYAEVAREMLELKNFIIPHLNYVPYLEKPPLLYWLIAVSYHFFGVSTLAARLIPSCASLFLTATLVFFLWNVRSKVVGWLAGLVTVSSFGLVLIGRVVFFDMLLTLFLTLAFSFFYIWYQKEKITYLIFSYFALALAFLTKGMLPVIIFASVILIFLFCMQSVRKKIFKALHPLAILIFLLLVLPWCILASQKLASFGWDYFINEQILRFLNKRLPHDYHTGPWYFYLPRILAYLFPWCLLLPTIFKRWSGKISAQGPLKVFCWIWFLVTLLIFSLSSAKGDYYMIVGMPALIILLALKLEEYVVAQNSKILFSIFLVTGFLIIVTGFYVYFSRLLPLAMQGKLLKILLLLIGYFFVGWFLLRKNQNPKIGVIIIAGFVMPLFIFGVNFESSEQDLYNQSVLTNYIQDHFPLRQVYLFQDYENFSSVLFNLKKRLPIVDSTSKDLYFGEHTKEADGWFITKQKFWQDAKKQDVYVVVLKSRINNFNENTDSKQFCIIKENAKTLLLTNAKNDCVLKN